MQNDSFYGLTPERVLEAVESLGLTCTGRCMALNSLENRVYDLEIEEETDDPAHPSGIRRYRVVAKFYRPGRWTREQILEEHAFLAELARDEIPVVEPMQFPNGSTLTEVPEMGIWVAVFPRVGGRVPDELDDEGLAVLGRWIARVHQAGARQEFKHRVRWSPEQMGTVPALELKTGQWIPLDYERRYLAAVEAIVRKMEPACREMPVHRIHGDCHRGNLLWRPADGPLLLDFDDCMAGSPVQDLWLLMPGDPKEMTREWEVFLEAYRSMRSFETSAMRWVEGFRALRIVSYSAWIAKRWKDPAFPIAFPDFEGDGYWRRETELLEGVARGL